MLAISSLDQCQGIPEEVPGIDAVAVDAVTTKASIEQPDTTALRNSNLAASNLPPDLTVGALSGGNTSRGKIVNSPQITNQGALDEREGNTVTDASARDAHDAVKFARKMVEADCPGMSIHPPSDAQDEPCVIKAQDSMRSGMKDRQDEANENYRTEAELSETDPYILKIKKYVGSKLRHSPNPKGQTLRGAKPPAVQSVGPASIDVNPKLPLVSASRQASTQKQKAADFDHHSARVQETTATPVRLQPVCVPVDHFPKPTDVNTTEDEGPVAWLPVYKLNKAALNLYWSNPVYESWAHTLALAHPMEPVVHGPTVNQVFPAQVTTHVPYISVTQTHPYEYASEPSHAMLATDGVPDLPARSVTPEIEIQERSLARKPTVMQQLCYVHSSCGTGVFHPSGIFCLPMSVEFFSGLHSLIVCVRQYQSFYATRTDSPNCLGSPDAPMFESAQHRLRRDQSACAGRSEIPGRRRRQDGRDKQIWSVASLCFRKSGEG